jgi:GAF domain-containing protein
MDPSNTTTLGVLQAINKLAGYFTKDDEKIIKLIASIAGISLRNALQFDEQVIYYNSLRNLLTVYEHLCGIQTIE